MVTSLAHFRSDYTIVHIPNGDFQTVRDHLYANINLLRLGCSRRTALTLEDPSETTIHRFISTYHLPEPHSKPLFTSSENLPLVAVDNPKGPRAQKNSSPLPPIHPFIGQSTTSLSAKTKDRSNFVSTVLELVKLVQAGLAIFGVFYSRNSPPTAVPPTLSLDGLLCDDTVEGIRTWIASIGTPCIGLEV